MTKPNRDVIFILSGGGVRGLAHAGVYATLCEKGYSVRYVIGTSAGALVGGMIAAGYESEELYSVLLKMNFADFVSKWKMVRHLRTILFDGCIDEGLLALWYEEEMRRKLALNDNRKVNFNDLKIPFVAVATNLTSYSHVIYSKEVTSEQSVTQAVIASSSFPFFFQAKRELANSITDGGLVANLPVSVLLDRQVLPNVESLQLFRPLVVAVHLKDSVESWGPFGKVTLGKKLVSAAMLSNAKLQLLLLKLLPWESCIIEVDVSSVSALDTSVGLDVKENLYNRGKQKALDALPVISGDFNPLRDNTFVKHNRNDSSDEKDRSHRNDYVIIRIVNDFLKKRAGEVSSLAVLSHVVESILGIANDVSVNYLREQIVRGNLWEFSDGIGVSGKGHDLLFELDRRI